MFDIFQILSEFSDSGEISLVAAAYDEITFDIDEIRLGGYNIADLRQKVGEIVNLSQELEESLLEYLVKNQEEAEYYDVLGKSSGYLLNHIDDFTEAQRAKIKIIVQLRNWVIHSYFKERFTMVGDRWCRSTSDKIIKKSLDSDNYTAWRDKSVAKLCITRQLLREAIDFTNDKIDKKRGYSGVANIID